MSDTLIIYLASWIIQDGNYEDFGKGDRAAFALEFYAPNRLSQIPAAREPSLLHCGAALYKLVGRVAYVADNWWVIDAGILIFRQEKPPEIQLGSWIAGDIHISIDPFFYFEGLSRQPDAPALIYEWVLEKIEIQTAPLIPQDARRLVRDPTRLGWAEISETDAWEHDGGRAEYLLHCKRLDSPPRLTLLAAGQ